MEDSFPPAPKILYAGSTARRYVDTDPPEIVLAALNKYLTDLVERGGSDLHLCSGSPPIIRLHGELVKLDSNPLPSDRAEALLREILTPRQVHDLESRKNLDFSYEVSHVAGVHRFRCNVYYQRLGLDGVFRAIPSRIPTLKELNLPQSLASLTRFSQGLVLMTGSSGSGKTTTLAALIDIINSEKGKHIITIEDPVEYVYTNKKSIIDQREVGTHTASFQSALRAAMREDPDVILVGELRDLETMQMAISASQTGHLVFATMHTSSAMRTIDRFIDAFPPSQQNQIRSMLSDSLRGIITQHLLQKAVGWGRVPAVEMLVGCLPIANLIREGKTHQINSVVQTQKNLGMIHLDESLLGLFQLGTITAQEAHHYATDKKLFEQHLTKTKENP
jgi:twitching motility protein PilT